MVAVVRHNLESDWGLEKLYMYDDNWETKKMYLSRGLRPLLFATIWVNRTRSFAILEAYLNHAMYQSAITQSCASKHVLPGNKTPKPLFERPLALFVLGMDG